VIADAIRRTKSAPGWTKTACVVYHPSDLPAALSLLENNGEDGYDTGALPGVPYVLLRLKHAEGDRREVDPPTLWRRPGGRQPGSSIGG
jgi:hypothetical protein